jgi:integrase
MAVDKDTNYSGVQKHGDQVRIVFMFEGKRCREAVNGAKQTPPGYAKANALREEILQKIKHGVFRYEDYFPHSNRVKSIKKPKSFEEVAKTWLKAKKLNCKDASIKAFTSQIAFWNEQFGKREVRDITHLDLLDSLSKKEGLTAKTRNNYLVPLRGIFDAAFVSGLITTDPTARLRNAKTEKPEPDPFTSIQMHKVLAYMQKHYPEGVWNYFSFAFGTGLRPSEMIELKWSDIDFDERKAKISRAKVGTIVQATKTRAKWPVKLTDLAFDALVRQSRLTRLKGPSAYVFENPATKQGWACDKEQRINYWTPALHGCGLHHRDAYQCRHTFATLLLMSGSKPAYIASQLGHVDATMVFRKYSEWIPDAAEDIAEAEKAADVFTKFAPPLPHEEDKPKKGLIFQASEWCARRDSNPRPAA